MITISVIPLRGTHCITLSALSSICWANKFWCILCNHIKQYLIIIHNPVSLSLFPTVWQYLFVMQTLCFLWTLKQLKLVLAINYRHFEEERLPIKMVKLEGKYRFVSQDNFDAYLKASGWLIFISLISD